MKEKELQPGGQIRNYLSCILKSSCGRGWDKLLLYADGLATGKKKGVSAMIRDLNARYSTSTVLRSLKDGISKLYEAKEERIARDRIDRRMRHLLILDDTPVKRYGRAIYGSGYHHDDSTGGLVWGNCLVTIQLRTKRGRWTLTSSSTCPRSTLQSMG
jgi:hypothetical protein